MPSEPLIGEIILFAGQFVPSGWADCDGRWLKIVEYQALYSIIGTTYGGDGQSFFALPDMRGRSPVGNGKGEGLPAVKAGDRGGQTEVKITTKQMPAHNHIVTTSLKTGDKSDPKNNIFAVATTLGGDTGLSYGDIPTDVKDRAVMASALISTEGGGESLPTRSPYLGLRFCIALDGAYPPRSIHDGLAEGETSEA